MSLVRGGKLRQDIAVNVLFAAAKVAALFWLIRVAGNELSPLALGIFLLARRISNTGANLLQLGASQTILRYVAINADNPVLVRAYAIVGFTGWAILAIFVGGASLLFRDSLGRFFFPANPDSSVALWTSFLLIATILDFLARSILIAERRLVAANVIELMNGSGFLILALAWESHPSVVGILRLQTTLMAALSLIALAQVLLRTPASSLLPKDAWAVAMKPFIVYGLARGLITFLDMGLLLIGPWMLRSDPVRAGFLIIGLSVVQAISLAASPIAQLAMVVSARLAERGNSAAVKEGVSLLVGGLLYAVMTLLAFLVPWKDKILILWLGDPVIAAGVLAQLNVLLWGVLPFATFQTLKGVIESLWIRPVNLVTLALSYGGFFIFVKALMLTGPSEMKVTSALTLAFWVLGISTIVWLKSYLPAMNYLGWPGLAALVGLLGAINVPLSMFDGVRLLMVAAIASTSAVLIFSRYFPTPFIAACQQLIWPSRQRT